MSSKSTQEYERTVLDILRSLPPERAGQLVDFARFLEGQYLADQLAADEDPVEAEADEARWNELMASADGQALVKKLIGEARGAYRTGKTSPLDVDDSGRIQHG